MRLARLMSILVALLSGLLARGQAGAQPACPPAVASTDLRLQAGIRPSNALIADATVELAEPAALYVEWGNDKVGWLRTPTDEPATVHHLPLMRLREDMAYQVRAFALNSGGCPAAMATTSVETDDLPSALQQLAVEPNDRPTFPLLMMDLRPPASSARWFVAVDGKGRTVWYYQMPSDLPVWPPPGRQPALVRLPNGDWLYIVRDYGVEEITPDGRVVRRIQLTTPPASAIHHDMTLLPDGRLLLIGEDHRVVDDTRNGGPVNLDVRGDTLHILDLDSGRQEQVWSAFDALDPEQRPPHRLFSKGMDDDSTITDAIDWTHANSVSLGPRGNVLVSMRHLDQVISLSPDFQSVEWRLGGPGSSFSFPDPTDRFWSQHMASELPNGHILLFDNGNFRPEGEYSRGLELELDYTGMTARKVWEYRHQPDIFADRVGNATRLPNGNTLINFGYRAEDPTEPVVTVEVQPDGTIRSELAMRFKGGRTSRYRAYPLTSLAGETSVEPTPFQAP